MPAEDVEVTVTFSEAFPTTFSQEVAKSENFDGESQSLFKKAVDSDPGTVVVEADAANANAKATGKVLKARGSDSGSGVCSVVTNSALGIEKVAYVQFDTRLDAGQTDKETSIALRDSANKTIFSIVAKASANTYVGTVKINSIDITDKAKKSNERDNFKNPDRDGTGWLTVSAAIDFDAKQSNVLITRVSDGSLVYFGAVPFADNDAAGLDNIFGTTGKQYGAVGLDDVTIKGAKATTVNVTTPDAANGTLTYKKDGSKIVIIPTPASGKKVKQVTVADGADSRPQVLPANESGAYVYTPTTDTVTIAAEFVRDDIKTVTVTGDDTVQKGHASKAAYVVTYANEKGEAVTLEDGEEVKWSVTGASNATGTKVEDGTLTLANDETGTEGKVTVVASVPKANGAADPITGSKEVTVSSDPVYAITKAAIAEGGDIEISLNSAAANTKIYVTAKPATGYEVDDIKIKGNATQDTSIKSSLAEGKYSFDMKGEDITVTATFKKIKYTITNGSQQAASTTNNGYISSIKVSDTEAAEAVMGDTVKVTLVPNANYESAGIEVEGADDIEVTGSANEYTFTMPAAAVTVKAKFQKEPLADRKPGEKYDQEIMAPIFDNTHAATGGNNNGAVKYEGSQKRVGDRLVTMASENRRADIPWANPNMKVDPCTIYVVFDFNVATGGSVLVQPAKDGSTKSTGFTIKEADGKLTINTKATDLEPDTWYNAVITGVRDASGNLTSSSLAVYAINEADDTVTTTTNLIDGVEVSGGGVIPWNCVHFLAVGDDKQSMFDNAYYCTDPFYESKITVEQTDDGLVAGGGNHPNKISDATVTVKKSGKEVATQKTGAEGVYTFKLQEGTYSVEVAATDYYTAAEKSVTVSKTGVGSSNNVTINPKKQPQELKSIAITGGVANQKVIAPTSGDGKVVANLKAVGLNENGVKLAEQPASFTWSTSDNVHSTVENGVVTVKPGATGEITITAKAADNEAITGTYKISIDADEENVVIFTGVDKFTFDADNKAGLGKFGDKDVVKLGTSGSTATIDINKVKSGAAVTAEEGQLIKFSANYYDGYLSGGGDITHEWKNSAGETIFKFVYNTGSSVIKSMEDKSGKIADYDGKYNFQNNKSDGTNGSNKAAKWADFSDKYYATLELVIDVQAKTFTATFKANRKADGSSIDTKVINGSLASLSKIDLQSYTISNSCNNADCSGGIGNVVTTITKKATD